MQMIKKAIPLLTLLLVMFWPSASQAYLDPATGSMLIQLLVGGAVAIGVTLKMYWEKVRFFWQKKVLKKDRPE
ncbi:MAG: hypothetical protein CMM45_07240 [Rhodospirillaceae bacterium]|nr:hypothetical protein [Rhodospirillaceae bacterium]|tara:strand:+ start:101 stop:319 length:219 start_codon:yes stop_codon:yes gene_type:complete